MLTPTLYVHSPSLYHPPTFFLHCVFFCRYLIFNHIFIVLVNPRPTHTTLTPHCSLILQTLVDSEDAGDASHGVRGHGLLPEEAGGSGGEGSRLGGAGVGVHLGGETQDPHVVPHTDLGRLERCECHLAGACAGGGVGGRAGEAVVVPGAGLLL